MALSETSSAPTSIGITDRDTDDPAAARAERNRLVVENLPLVGYLVSEVWARASHLSRDDLAAAGALALVTAADSFDPAYGVPFGAFARRRIMGAFADEMRAADWATRGARERIKAVTSTRETLSNALGRAPEVEELASATGLDRAAVVEALNDAARTVQPLDETVADRLASDAEAPGENLLVEERLAYLRAAVEALPERQRAVIDQVYFQDKSVSEIARELGITHSAVSQQRSAAVKLLREGLAAHYSDSDEAHSASGAPVALSHVGAPAVSEVTGAAAAKRIAYLARMAAHPLLRRPSLTESVAS
ncbi:sigma-70 family RNA polymerase sigma factor [Ruicaihuangia caeni]|uniref:sigma-70 family RNA polymerase sigma factor n=1 Tax=Ruicaihuangia caeni TaxID=3042517 RepID=UPI00338ED01D